MIKLAIKDLKLFLKDRRSLLLTFAIPIALITLFAYAYGGAGNSTEDSKIAVLISDQDHSSASKSAIEILDTLKGISLKPKELNEAIELIKKGNESCVLIIHKGFSDSLKAGKSLPLELQYDEARDIEVGLLQQSLIPTVAQLPFSIGNPKDAMNNRFDKLAKDANSTTKAEINSYSDRLIDALTKGISESGKSQNPSNAFFDENIKMTKLIKANNDSSVGLIQATAGTAVMMLLFSVVGIGMSLLDEKQEGTLKRLLYTPIKPVRILFGKMISANVISIFQLLIMFIYTSLVFGLELKNHWPGLLLTIIATAFACSAFGVLLAAFAKTRQQVQGLSTLIVLVMSAIGGSMIPIFFMPALMQKVAVLSVNYWSIQSFFDVFWRNLAITSPDFLFRILILFLIGATLNGLAMWMFNKNILKMT